MMLYIFLETDLDKNGLRNTTTTAIGEKTKIEQMHPPNDDRGAFVEDANLS